MKIDKIAVPSVLEMFWKAFAFCALAVLRCVAPLFDKVVIFKEEKRGRRSSCEAVSQQPNETSTILRFNRLPNSHHSTQNGIRDMAIT